MEDHKNKRVAKWGPRKRMEIKNGIERGMSSRMGMIGPHPGIFRKNGF
jgi:hypothetical protein